MRSVGSVKSIPILRNPRETSTASVILKVRQPHAQSKFRGIMSVLQSSHVGKIIQHSLVIILVQIGSLSHRLMCLHSQFLVGGTLWEGYGTFRRQNFAGGSISCYSPEFRF